MTQTENADPPVYFHSIRANVPSWIWRARFHAEREAPAGSRPVIIVDQQPHPFVIIDVADYNVLVGGEKGGTE